MVLTEKEQVLISNAMFGIIFELEGAQAVLDAAHRLYFQDEQKDIPASAAETLGKLLNVYLGMMYNAIKQYKQIVGED